MTSQTALTETALAQECLRHLGEDKNVLHRAAHVLEMVAHSSVGLGEVLQDFAHQAWSQLHEVIRASRNAANGLQSGEDIAVLANAHMILKSVKVVLERTPAAMLHNKAESLGITGKEKISREDVMRITHEFSHSPDIERLLASEDSGRMLVSLLPQGNGEVLAGPGHLYPENEARH
jgi:hypothetical protein